MVTMKIEEYRIVNYAGTTAQLAEICKCNIVYMSNVVHRIEAVKTSDKYEWRWEIIANCGTKWFKNTFGALSCWCVGGYWRNSAIPTQRLKSEFYHLNAARCFFSSVHSKQTI